MVKLKNLLTTSNNISPSAGRIKCWGLPRRKTHHEQKQVVKLLFNGVVIKILHYEALYYEYKKSFSLRTTREKHI